MTERVAELYQPGPCVCGREDCDNFSIYDADDDARVSFTHAEAALICGQLNRFWSRPKAVEEALFSLPIPDLMQAAIVAAKVQHMSKEQFIIATIAAWEATTVELLYAHPGPKEDQ